MDHYLHNSESTIKTDQTRLKFLLESFRQNRKVQLLTLGIAVHNIEYTQGYRMTQTNIYEGNHTGVKVEPDIIIISI